MESPLGFSPFKASNGDASRDLSFYDQPDDLSAMTSPLATPTSNTSTISRSSSTSSLESLVSEAESSSSVEQVFFGPVGIKERTLIARLSKVDLDDRERTETEEKQFDKENSKRRVTRRDSKEFHRRKTLVFSSRASLANSPRAWGNGFYVKDNDKLPQSPLAFWSSENSKPPSRTNASSKTSTPLEADRPCITDTDQLNPFLEASNAATESQKDEAEEEEVEAEQQDLADQEEGEADSASEVDAPVDKLEDDSDTEPEIAQPQVQEDVSEQENAGSSESLEVRLDELMLEDSAHSEALSSDGSEPQELSLAANRSLTFAEQVGQESPSEPEPSTRSQKSSSRGTSSRRRSSRLESKRLQAEDERESDRPGASSRRSVVEAEASEDSAGVDAAENRPEEDTSEVGITAQVDTQAERLEKAQDPEQADDGQVDKEESNVIAASSDGTDTSRETAQLENEPAVETSVETSACEAPDFTEERDTASAAVEDAPEVLDESVSLDFPVDETGQTAPRPTGQLSEAHLIEETEVEVTGEDTRAKCETLSTPATPEASKDAEQPVVHTTPSQHSEAGETTFDPESPMPVCRAPKPELMMGFSPVGKRDLDQDVLPLGRQSSLSPIAQTVNVAKFHLGSFDLARDTLGSSTLRIRQAFSPEQRNVFALQPRIPVTPLRTPSKQQPEAPRSAFVQRSIALPPVTKMLDRKLTKQSTPRTDRKKEPTSGRRSVPALGATVADMKQAAAPCDTPAKSRRKSLRSAVASAAATGVVVPIINTAVATRQTSPPDQSTIVVQATPDRPIPTQPVASTSSAIPKVAQSTDSKLRQPTKSLLKKPSTSFLPVLKSAPIPSRTLNASCNSVVPAISNVQPTTSFDFAQPLPNQKITTFAPASKSRSALPIALKSPVKQVDVFSSLGPPIRPNHRGPIVSTARGPPVRPNMTPVRNGIRAFGSPVRSNLSPIKNPVFGTPQRTHQYMSHGTPQQVHVGMDSPGPAARRLDFGRNRLQASTSAVLHERSSSLANEERPLQGRFDSLPRSKMAEHVDAEPSTIVVERAPMPVVPAPSAEPVHPTSVAATVESAAPEVPTVTSSSATSRRSSRPARTALNLASSSTSEAVKPSRAAGKREKPKAAAGPPATSKPAVVVDVESITKLNTTRNEVVFSAITTIKQRRQGERPRGDILTIAEKIASLSREERALRRQLEKSGATSKDEDRPSGPLDSHRRGAGETEDYMTPARPAKRARDESESPTRGPASKKSRTIVSLPTKTAGPREERRVRWDKGLIMISDSRKTPSEASSQSQGVKGCLKKNIVLDHLGNVPNASLSAPGLQPLPVEVLKIRYDGEDFSDGEPGETKSTKRGEKAKGRKKASTPITTTTTEK